MEFDLKSKIYKSSIDSSFMVIISKKMFKFMNDDAMCDLDKKVIFINGDVTDNWTNNHFLCIEAHEISHYIAGHCEYGKQQHEMEADKMAYIILLLKFKLKAAKIIRDRFEDLYNLNMCYFSMRKILYIKVLKFHFRKVFRKIIPV